MPVKTKKASSFDRKKLLFLAPVVSLLLLAALIYSFKGVFVAAKVGNQLITRQELDKELEKQAGKQALDNMVIEKLIIQEAKKKGVQASSAEIDVKMGEIDNQFKAQGQSLETYLASRGQTKDDLKKQVKVQLLVEKMLGDSVKVTDQEIKDYFDKNKSTFPKNATLDNQKEQIKNNLTQEKLSTSFQSWIETLRKDAKIDYFITL